MKPEYQNYTFNHTEIAEILIRKLNIHEGLWGVYFEFNFGALNMTISEDLKEITPAAVALIKKVGIQRFDTPCSLTVDAAIVNPEKIRGKK